MVYLRKIRVRMENKPDTEGSTTTSTNCRHPTAGPSGTAASHNYTTCYTKSVQHRGDMGDPARRTAIRKSSGPPGHRNQRQHDLRSRCRMGRSWQLRRQERLLRLDL